MEQQIREYEEFIAQKVKSKMSEADRRALAELHCETVTNFQHERLIHLLVTLFFALFTIAMILVAASAVMTYGFKIEFLPLGLLVLVLVVITGFYLKHYYFLENHIQKLYKFTRELRD